MQKQVDCFLHYLKHEKNYSLNTIAAYQNDLQQFLVFLLQQELETCRQVALPHVDLYVRGLEQQYAVSTVARKAASVRSFFHYLVRLGVLDDDPTSKLNSPQVQKRLPAALTAEDVERLLAEPAKSTTPKALRDAALLDLLYSTGMRVSEIVAVRLSQIDLEQAVVCYANKDGSERQLPIDERALHSLRVYLNHGRDALLKDRRQDTLFLNQRGLPLSRQGLWLIIKGYAETASLGRDVTPHTLRHSFAAHRLNRGSSLPQIQALLGHTSISATKIYTQFVQPLQHNSTDQ